MSIWNEINTLGKKSVIAKIGGFRPESIEYSMFGGGFYLENKESWPQDSSGNMVPVLQIKVGDVPNGNKIFGDVELIQVYLNKSLPAGHIISNGNGWLLKEYDSVDGLVLIDTPEDVRFYKQFPIRWTESKDKDFPCWEETWRYVDLTEINESEELSDRFFDEYSSYNSTKIGGFASYIQSPVEEKEYCYVFQISSEEKARFMIADNGNLYFYKSKKDGSWFLHWDCY